MKPDKEDERYNSIGVRGFYINRRGKTKCSICKEEVIAYYERGRLEFLCPICFVKSDRRKNGKVESKIKDKMEKIEKVIKRFEKELKTNRIEEQKQFIRLQIAEAHSKLEVLKELLGD